MKHIPTRKAGITLEAIQRGDVVAEGVSQVVTNEER
jgi:hypothetical protein